MAAFRRYFLLGALVIFPLASVLWVVKGLILVITQPISQVTGIPLNGWRGAFIGILFICAVGGIVQLVIKRSIFKKIDALVLKVPILRIIYQTFRQVVSRIIHNNKQFLATVFIEYPSSGIWSIGFLTNDSMTRLDATPTKTLLRNPVAVFIPSAPNPTNGMFVFVESSRVHRSSLSIEDGIKCVMSAGMITPEEDL